MLAIHTSINPLKRPILLLASSSTRWYDIGMTNNILTFKQKNAIAILDQTLPQLTITQYFCYDCKGRDFSNDNHIIATEEGDAARMHLTCFRKVHPFEKTWTI